MALGSMNALESGVEGTSLQRPLERAYDIAGAVIDGVLPQGQISEDVNESVLRRKNPIRKIGKRMSLKALRMLPGTTAQYALQTTKSKFVCVCGLLWFCFVFGFVFLQCFNHYQVIPKQ